MHAGGIQYVIVVEMLTVLVDDGERLIVALVPGGCRMTVAGVLQLVKLYCVSTL